MARKKILFVSLLKPVTEPRMYEKLALPLAQTSKYAINIIGFKAKNLPDQTHIDFHPLFDFHRLSWKRLLAPWKYYKKLLKVKPKLIVINTHDLLIVTVIYKILFGSKICYDVQENYWRNIRYGRGLPEWLRLAAATFVRLQERISAPFIDSFLLAERCYVDQLPFDSDRSIVLENKYTETFTKQYSVKSENEKIHLVYTGTIALSRGILEAIDFAIRINHIRPVMLTIAGYASQLKVRDIVSDACARHSFIKVEGLNDPLPYERIQAVIHAADVVLIPLQTDPSTADKIPTKVYEALALRKRMIIQENPAIERLCSTYNACIAIDFKHFKPSDVVRQIENQHFYSTLPGNEVLWASEEEKWIRLVSELTE